MKNGKRNEWIGEQWKVGETEVGARSDRIWHIHRFNCHISEFLRAPVWNRAGSHRNMVSARLPRCPPRRATLARARFQLPLTESLSHRVNGLSRTVELERLRKKFACANIRLHQRWFFPDLLSPRRGSGEIPGTETNFAV